jgi:hypothetical protein
MAHASSVLCGVLVMIAVQSTPANSNAHLRCSGSEASSGWLGDVAISALVPTRVKIAQPDIDTKGCQPAAERAVAPARIEATRGKPRPSRDNPTGRLATRSAGVG